MAIETSPAPERPGQAPSLRESRDGFRWNGVVHAPYKQQGAAPFRAISRQTLFDEAALGCELRYFEMEDGGYSTLERHQHSHAVMILRGHGHCLLGETVRSVKPLDLITIPAWVWHQFRATGGEPLGFLCMVNRDRDRPQLPSEKERAEMAAKPALSAFLAGGVAKVAP